MAALKSDNEKLAEDVVRRSLHSSRTSLNQITDAAAAGCEDPLDVCEAASSSGGGLLVLQLRLREGDERREEGAAAGPGQSLHLLQDGDQGQDHLAHLTIVTVCNAVVSKRENPLPLHLSERR